MSPKPQGVGNGWRGVSWPHGQSLWGEAITPSHWAGTRRSRSGGEGSTSLPTCTDRSGCTGTATLPRSQLGEEGRVQSIPSSHPFGHPHCFDIFGVSVQDPRAGGNVIFCHGRCGSDRAEGDFPPALHLASFKVRIERRGAASKRTGSVQAACSHRQIWLRSPQESNSSPAKKAAPVPGGCPRGCSGPGRSGFGAYSPAAWPGQEMRPRQLSAHSSQPESE